MSYTAVAVALRTVLLMLLAGSGHALAAGPQLPLPDTLTQRLVACTSCHAASGAPDPFFPRISGKPAGYLYNQLVNFRDGRRQFPVMRNMVDHLPDPYLREIADYFSAQHLPPLPVQAVSISAAMAERGRQLVLQGDAALKVPACVACHGERLTGALPSIAGLAGLPRDYINAQLGNWRNHSRRALAPDCMATIAARLSLDDVAAVSGWIAQRPLPANMAPAAPGDIARPLPLACGSAPDPTRAAP